MRRGSDSRVSKAVLAWMRFDECDQFLDVVGGDRWVDHQHVGRDGGERDRRKIPVRIIGNLGIKAGVYDEARADDSNCVAVGGCTCGRAHAEIAAGTRLILDVELLTEALR